MNKLVKLISIIYSTNIYSKINYTYLRNSLNFGNYNKILKILDDNKENNLKYTYEYNTILKNIITLNLLSNKLDLYLEKFKEQLTELSKSNKKKYKIKSIRRTIYIYNLFIERGIKYLHKKRYDKSIKCFNIAKSFINTEEINLIIGYTKQLQKEYINAKDIYNNFSEITKEKSIIEKINSNMLEIYMLEKNYEKVKNIMKEILKSNEKQIQYLEILQQLKYIHNINIEDILSEDKTINKFQKAVMLYFNKSYKEAFNMLKELKLKKLEELILYSDVMYNYSIKLQDELYPDEVIKPILMENIKICNKILKLDTKNDAITHRLLYLYITINDKDNTNKLAAERRIKP